MSINRKLDQYAVVSSHKREIQNNELLIFRNMEKFQDKMLNEGIQTEKNMHVKKDPTYINLHQKKNKAMVTCF